MCVADKNGSDELRLDALMQHFGHGWIFVSGAL
jgi:hypothetical protein